MLPNSFQSGCINFYSNTVVWEGSVTSHPHQRLALVAFKLQPSCRSVTMSHGGFNLHFLITNEAVHIFMFIGHLDILFCKCLSLLPFYPLSFLSSLFFLIAKKGCFVIYSYVTSIPTFVASIFILVHSLPLSLPFFTWQNTVLQLVL